MRKLMIAIACCLGTSVAADEGVIAALGDSLTQGYGLPEAEGFVSQLQRWLIGAGADVRLINAGVSGDTTAGGLSRAGWTMTPEVDGLILALGGNDLLRGLDPDVSRKNIDGILQAADTAEVEVLLVGMTAPGNYGPEYKAEFDAIYPELAEEYDTLLLSSFFAGLTEDDETPDLSALRGYFQPDGIHPNAEGIAKIVERIGPAVLELVARIEGG